MRERRFLLLAATLVALNAALWLATGALGLGQGGLASLYGKNMVRSQVIENTGCPSSCVEWNIDRGIVLTNKAGVLTITEADTKVQPIPVASSTRVSSFSGKPVGVSGIKPGWRVLVTWPALSGPAQSVVIEKRGKS